MGISYSITLCAIHVVHSVLLTAADLHIHTIHCHEACQLIRCLFHLHVPLKFYVFYEIKCLVFIYSLLYFSFVHSKMTAGVECTKFGMKNLMSLFEYLLECKLGIIGFV